MSLNETLLAHMKVAMKERESGKLKVSVIRLLRAAIQNEEIDKRHELSEEEMLEVIAREVKKRKEVIPDYQRAGRDAMVQQLTEEVEILQNYLPDQMTEDEIRSLISGIISETEAKGPNDMGKIMKLVIPKTKGRADGKMVSSLVKQMLE
ncbi:MAG: GatB/YqeY domain-containing protein [Ignavibacteriales bacterium]